MSREKIIRTEVVEEYGGFTATFYTDQGNEYEGRSHHSQGLFGNKHAGKVDALTKAREKFNEAQRR